MCTSSRFISFITLCVLCFEGGGNDDDKHEIKICSGNGRL